MSNLTTPSEFKAILKNTALFGEVEDAALEQLARGATLREYPPGQPICIRNSPGDEFYAVHKGTVDLFIATHPSVPEDPLRDKLMKNATDAVVRVVPPGEYFGELACLQENGTRTATAVSLRGCTLLVVPKDVFLQTLRQFPNAALAVLGQVAERLRWHTDHLARTVRKEELVRPEDRAARDKASRNWWQSFADSAVDFFSNRWVFSAHIAVWIVWFLAIQCMPDPPAVEPAPVAVASKPGVESGLQKIVTVNGLTNIVSLEAIVLAIFILVAQRRKEENDNSREQVQFTNTSVTVEQTTMILQRLVHMEAELRHDRLQATIRERRTQPPQAPQP